MSRVGKKPVIIPEGIKVSIFPDRVEFESSRGKASSPVYPGITARLDGSQLIFERNSETRQVRAFHGLCRTLAQNAILGLTQGFVKQLEISGVGYRARVDKNILELSLGYARPVQYKIPEGIEITVEKQTLITIKGSDKQKVGQVAQEIRSFRPPDPYTLKGIRYVGERLIRKERRAGVGGA
jgi:large subunit ribosomal protein L6